MRGIKVADLLRCYELAARRGYVGPRGTEWAQGDNRYRLVRDERWERPATETFDEFIVVHLKHVLGKEWGKRHVALPRDDQHVVVRWMFDAAKHQKKVLPKDHTPGELYVAQPSGSAMELLAFAEDVYRLSLRERLPRKLLRRLRDPVQFQGARYEVALAAAFTRSGFRVDWLEEDSSMKRAEFNIALDGKDVVAVEAKSRHRAGTLHQEGERDKLELMKADVQGLYSKALKKEVDGLPFLICIDVNLPPQLSQQGTMPPWTEDVRAFLDDRPPTEDTPAKEFCLCFTNFNWHFQGAGVARGGRHIYTFPEWTEHAPQEEKTYVGILHAFDRYGGRPEGVY